MSALLTKLAAYLKDPAALKAHLASAVGAVVAVIGIVHPGFSEPSWVPAALGVVGGVAAVASQVLNLLRRQKVKAAK